MCNAVNYAPMLGFLEEKSIQMYKTESLLTICLESLVWITTVSVTISHLSTGSNEQVKNVMNNNNNNVSPSAVSPPLSAMSDSDDDVPTLSADTLAALQEFYKENSARGTTLSNQFAVGAVEEDWVSLLDLFRSVLYSVAVP